MILTNCSGLDSIRYFVFEIFADIILDRDGSVSNLLLKRVVTVLYTTNKQNKIIDFYLKNFSLTNDVRDTLLGVKSLPLVPWKK